MKQTAKEFALAQLAPYFKNPETCGISGGACQYLTKEGKMCIAGKNLTKTALKEYAERGKGIQSILEEKGEQVLTAKARKILTPIQWGDLQVIHDRIARGDTIGVKNRIEQMRLFLFEDLEKYADDLK